jgi:hypothetical protein
MLYELGQFRGYAEAISEHGHQGLGAAVETKSKDSSMLGARENSSPSPPQIARNL